VTKILEGIASRETIRFLTLRYLMISKIQRSWRQFCDVTIIGRFQTGLKTTLCMRLQGSSQLYMPLYSQLILCIYTAINGLGGGAKMELSRARETLGMPLQPSGGTGSGSRRFVACGCWTQTSVTGNAARQWLLIAVSHQFSYGVKRRMSE